MINPLNFIAEILQTHDSCLLPGLGVIQRKKQASHYDIRLSEFRPPEDQFLFIETTDQEAASERYSIIDYMAASGHIMYSIAQTQWEVFIKELHSRLLSGEPISIQGIGILRKSSDGTISLDGNTQGDTFYPLLEGIPLLKASTLHSEPVTEKTEQSSEILVDFDKIKHSGQFRNLWIWVVAILVALFAILGYLYFRELPAFRTSQTVQPPASPKFQEPAENADSASSSPVEDTVSGSAAALSALHDSMTYNFVIARFASQQKAARYSEKMIHWGHPTVVKHQDSSYYVCIESRLLPADTSKSKTRLARLYGPRIFILYSPE